MFGDLREDLADFDIFDGDFVDGGDTWSVFKNFDIPTSKGRVSAMTDCFQDMQTVQRLKLGQIFVVN